MRDTETERGRDPGRGRSRVPVGSPMWGLDTRTRGYDLSQRQMLNHRDPEPLGSRHFL